MVRAPLNELLVSDTCTRRDLGRIPGEVRRTTCRGPLLAALLHPRSIEPGAGAQEQLAASKFCAQSIHCTRGGTHARQGCRPRLCWCALALVLAGRFRIMAAPS